MVINPILVALVFQSSKFTVSPCLNVRCMEAWWDSTGQSAESCDFMETLEYLTKMCL